MVYAILYTPHGIYHLQPFTLVCTTLNRYIPCHVPKKLVYTMGQGQVKIVYTMVYNLTTNWSVLSDLPLVEAYADAMVRERVADAQLDALMNDEREVAALAA
jgi:hypothetical protein